MYLTLSDPSADPHVPLKQFSSETVGPLVLGRASKSDAAASDPSSPKFRSTATKVMSSSHATLHWEGEYAFLTDLGSTNGSVLVRDGEQQKLKPDVPYRIFSQDRLVFGRPVTQRARGALPVVNEPLALVAELKPTPTLTVRRPANNEDGSQALVSDALVRDDTVSQGNWRDGTTELSHSEDDSSSMAQRAVADETQRERPRRVSFAGSLPSESSSVVSNASGHGADDGSGDVKMAFSTVSKRGFGLSEDDLLNSRDQSPELTLSTLPEVDNLQLDASAKTTHVEVSHSPMDVDSVGAHSPRPEHEHDCKLEDLAASTGLLSPVSPEFATLPIKSQDQLEGDEAAMPRSTNPSQKKVGRTLLDMWRVEPSSGMSPSPSPAETTALPGGLGLADEEGKREQVQLSSALFAGESDDAFPCVVKPEGEAPTRRFAATSDEEDEVEHLSLEQDDLLSQAASQLPSPVLSTHSVDSESDGGDIEDGSDQRDSEAFLLRDASVDSLPARCRALPRFAIQGGAELKDFLPYGHFGNERDLWAAAESAGEEEDGPEPPTMSSPASKRVALFMAEQAEEDALIQAAESVSAGEVDSEDDDEEHELAIKPPTSPLSERIFALIEEQQEERVPVFEAEHTPDDLVVESLSAVEWSDRGEDDARELIAPVSAQQAADVDDDENDVVASSSDESDRVSMSPALSSHLMTHLAAAFVAHSAELQHDLASAITRCRAAESDVGQASTRLEAALSDDDDGGSSGCGDVSTEDDSEGQAVGGSGSSSEEFEDEESQEEEEEEGDEELSQEEQSEAGASSVAGQGDVDLSMDETDAIEAPAASTALPYVDPDLDQRDPDLDAVDLDVEADAFIDEDAVNTFLNLEAEECAAIEEVDQQDGFDDDGAEWEDGVSEKLAAPGEVRFEKANLVATESSSEMVSRGTSPLSSTSHVRKRRFSDTDLDERNSELAGASSQALSVELPVGVPKSAQTDLSFPAAAVAPQEEERVTAPIPKRRRLNLAYKSFALGVVTGIVGAVAGLSALGSALESLE